MSETSSIARAMGELKLVKDTRTPGHPDARVPEQPDARTAERAGVQAAGRADGRVAERADTRTPGRAPGLALQGTGKRSHPDFTKRTVFLRDATWLKASRKWEDEGNGDFSDLVGALIVKYAAGQIDVDAEDL